MAQTKRILVSRDYKSRFPLDQILPIRTSSQSGWVTGPDRHNGYVNVLWIITDDQMRSTLGKMPEVWTRLVKTGTRFYRGYAAVPLCGPARVSMLTGMYVHNHGVETNWTLRPFRNAQLDQDTVATRLQGAGWTTGLFGKYLNGYPRDPEHVAPGWDR